MLVTVLIEATRREIMFDADDTFIPPKNILYKGSDTGYGPGKWNGEDAKSYRFKPQT
jgi:hypothetical protein